MVANIARIPPKNVSTSDKDLLRNLERDLKMVVFGQDPAIESLSTAIKLARAGLKAPEKPEGHSCLPVRLVLVKPKSPNSWRKCWALSWFDSICPNIWSGIQCHA